MISFNINGVQWQVEFVSWNNPVLIRSDGVLTLGVTDLNLRTVFIADNLPEDLERKVFIHEISHCCMFSYGIFTSVHFEEIICDFVASHCDEIIDVVNEIFCVLHKHKLN